MVAQPVEDQLQLFPGGGHGPDVAVAASASRAAFGSALVATLEGARTIKLAAADQAATLTNTGSSLGRSGASLPWRPWPGAKSSGTVTIVDEQHRGQRVVCVDRQWGTEPQVSGECLQLVDV